MSNKFIAFLFLLIIINGCEEDCDCNYTIITAGEQFIQHNQTGSQVSEELKSMSENIILFYRDSFPNDYRYRSLEELCAKDDNGEKQACKISYIITIAESSLSIKENGIGINEIKLHKSIKPMVIDERAFNLHSLEFPPNNESRKVQFIYEYQSVAYLSQEYQLENGLLYSMN